MLPPTSSSMVAFGTMMSVCTGVHFGIFCIHHPIKVFKLLVIGGDLDWRGGYKMFSCRYANTKGICLVCGVFSDQGGCWV